MSQDCRQDNFEGNPALGLQGHHNLGMSAQQNSSSAESDDQQWRNYPKIGQEHPDGPNVRRVHENHKDNLNFGWFTLPRTSEGTEGSGGGTTTENRRPDSKAAVPRGGDEQVPPSRCGNRQFPPSRMGQRPDSQQNSGEPDRLVMDPTENSDQKQDIDPGHGNEPPVSDDDVVVDWPLSKMAQEIAMKFQPRPASSACREKPSSARNVRPSRAGRRDIPPTPMPPLSWGGYGNSARPTFGSWREEWHRNHKCDPQEKYKDFNCNNNNNNDVNNNAKESNGGAKLMDVNNINKNRFWSPKSYNRTSSKVNPEQYKSTLPKLYCPNVVMKWEDTDDQGQTLPRKQRFPYKSFRDRVRGSFDNLLSVCCMKKLKTRIVDKMKMRKYKKFDNYGKKEERPDEQLY